MIDGGRREEGGRDVLAHPRVGERREVALKKENEKKKLTRPIQGFYENLHCFLAVSRRAERRRFGPRVFPSRVLFVVRVEGSPDRVLDKTGGTSADERDGSRENE